MNKPRLALVALALAVTTAGCAAATEKPLPIGSDRFPDTVTTVPASVAIEETPVTTVTTVEVQVAASTCDVVREALLTGTTADIEASMAQLVADKSADATAREYADYYINRDKTQPTMREMDISLIRMSCS